jgi:hypothetical protein
MEKKTKEIVIKENYSLDKIKDMTAMATILKTHIVRNKLYTCIQGKNYCQVEGWQFAGGLMGIFPRVVKTTNLSNDKEIKWSADVELIDRKTGSVIGSGFALCSANEAKGGKRVRTDEYAILSMAQTRAIGKAYRNVIGWVMKLAGYEGTPSEEMHKVDQTPKEPTIEYQDDHSEPQEAKKGQVKGPDGKPTWICEKCKDPISDQVHDFSLKVYKKALCRDCQKEAKK